MGHVVAGGVRTGAVLVDAVVPFAEIPPDAPATGDCQRPYAQGWERLRATRVGRIFVGVDLATRRVADIGTDATKEIVSPAAGRPYPLCRETPSR